MSSSNLRSALFAVFLVVSCVTASAVATRTVGSSLLFNFLNDMEGWQSYREEWHWADRNTLTNTLPENSVDNGFAVMDTAYHSDELFTPYVSVPLGGSLTIKFFVRSRWEGSNSLKVDLMQVGKPRQELIDLSKYSNQYSSTFVTETVEIPPAEDDVLMIIFCYNGENAPDGDLMYGCAVDQIEIEINGDETTTVSTTVASTTTDTPVTTTTEAPETTAAPTEAPVTTVESTEAPVTTEAPTDAPETTEKPTEAPETTEEPTEAPETTEEPTDAPETTEEPTDAPVTTEEPTDAPETTEEPTEAPETTEEPTEAPETTEEPTDAPETTEEPTDAPETTEEPTDAPETTEEPTDAPETTEEPTDAPETTEEPTEAPTDAPETTAAPTEAPETTAAPTEAPETTEAPTDAPETTTQGPSGPLEYDFQEDSQGWTLSQTNGAAWKRVQFNNTGLPVPSPPEGPWVLQVFSTDVFAGTTLAQSPKLEAIDSTLRIELTFWMDGDRDLPSQLKVRRRSGFDSYDLHPAMNLDAYGDQTNYRWIVYSAALYNMQPGETFTVTLEGSLGGHPNNSVAINKVVLEGVKEISFTDASNIVDFEDGLFGWSVGNMDGGRWVLQNWNNVDSALNVPQPSDGENFLMVERFDIHSGVISLESPAFPIEAGEVKKVHIKFWLRGSVVYPAALRLRKKTMNGDYDALPFLNLAPYGDIDHPNWMVLDREYDIPVDETEKAFQLVIEADLGSDADNMVALDDLKIITVSVQK